MNANNLLGSECQRALDSDYNSPTDLAQSLCKTIASLCSTSNRFVDLRKHIK